MSANTLLTSVVTGGSNSHATTAEEANSFNTDFVTAGVVGSIALNTGSGGTGSFCVNADASPDMGITIKAGQAYITATPSGQNSQTLRVRAATDYTAYTINANASGSTKYDWIYLKIDATKANNPAADASDVASFVTSRSSSNTSDTGSPPTYGLVLAVITVANGASSITNGNIQDKRVQAGITLTASTNSTGWTTVTSAISSVSANGNHSYNMVFNGVDLTGTLSPGMRIRTTRTVAAPTQCTSLNGSTQYYSKTSPAGMTFTNNFVCMAWVKLSSYGSASSIISRYNGTSGFDFQVVSDGRIQVLGYNAGSSNTKSCLSYQSIPLNKWVHVAIKIDMSSSTVTGGTNNYILIDGVEVPCQQGSGGTAPTAIIQAGDLEIGSRNGGTQPFPGKIAQAAIFSAHVSESTIQSYISQTLAGSETSLVSAYSFNNTINDLNANANNLTANGSAVATNADSPFGGQAGGAISSTLDYGIITSASFSTNTTLVVQVPEGCTIPTSGGVSAVSYSTQAVPYLFPNQKGKWNIISLLLVAVSQSSATNGTWYNLASHQLNIPTGEWQVNYQTHPYISNTTGSIYEVTLSTSSSAETNKEFTSEQYFGTTTTGLATERYRRRPVSLATATPYYLIHMNSSGSSTTLQTIGNSGSAIIEAECAYL